MNNVLNIFLATIIIFFSSNIFAEGFNDNYFQLGFESSDSSVLEKDLYGQIASVERQADGVTKLKIADKITDIRGSISLGQNVSLIGSYATETGKWTDGCACTNFWEKNWDGKSTITSLGIGKNFDINANNLGGMTLSYTQLTTSLSAAKIQSDLTSFRVVTQSKWDDISQEKDFSIFSMGIRTISNFDIELGAKYIRLAGNGVHGNEFEVEAVKKFSKNLALGAKFASQENGNKAGFFFRTSF